MSDAKTTTDHETIRKWLESRGGYPATVSATGDESDAGILRVAFDKNSEDLTEVPWDEFFETFEERKLAFLYEEKTDSGQQSRFSKFVNRE